LNSFDPSNICTNNVGDLGSSPNGVPLSFGFNVPAGATFMVVVSEVTVNTGCAGYTLDIAGLPCAGATPTPTASPTSTPTISITGTVTYCSNPVPGPVPNVTLTLSDGVSDSTTTTGPSGTYEFSSLTPGVSYIAKPSKADLPPGAAGINTQDVLTVQQHYLNVMLIPEGCRREAADVNGDGRITTSDALSIQRFLLGNPIGIGSTGKYKFTPASRSYPSIMTSQMNQDYDVFVYGDVTANFVE